MHFLSKHFKEVPTLVCKLFSFHKFYLERRTKKKLKCFEILLIALSILNHFYLFFHQWIFFFFLTGELGDYDPLNHKEGYLAGFQFVPNQVCVVYCLWSFFLTTPIYLMYFKILCERKSRHLVIL